MGRERVGACRQRLRFATPGATLALGVFIVVMLVAAAVISSVSHHFRLSSLGQVALILSFAVVGVIAAWHQPRNPMGWVLLGVTFFFLLDDLASPYAYLDYRLHGGRLPLGWLAVLLAPSWAPAIVPGCRCCFSRTGGFPRAGVGRCCGPTSPWARSGWAARSPFRRPGIGTRTRHGVDGARMKSGNPQCRTPSVNKPGTTLVGKRT
jgi:hypothetical protein